MGVNTAKKTTGKGAKKTISGRPASGLSARRPVAKKSAGGDSGIKSAIEDLAQTQKKSILAMEKTIQNLSASVEKTTQETRQTTTDLAESIQETRQELRQTTTDLANSVAKTTTDLAESIDKVNDNVGGVNRSLGRIVEMVVLPGLMDKMNATYNYQFDNVSSDKIFRDNGQQYAEVDLFLENGDSVMAVEAKARVKEGDVNKLVATLQKLRAHEVKAGLVGKTIYGAVAGIVFDVNARRVAEASGLYLVDIDQDNERIKVELIAEAAGKW